MNWFRLTVLILLVYIARLLSIILMLEVGDYVTYV